MPAKSYKITKTKAKTPSKREQSREAQLILGSSALDDITQGLPSIIAKVKLGSAEQGEALQILLDRWEPLARKLLESGAHENADLLANEAKAKLALDSTTRRFQRQRVAPLDPLQANWKQWKSYQNHLRSRSGKSRLPSVSNVALPPGSKTSHSSERSARPSASPSVPTQMSGSGSNVGMRVCSQASVVDTSASSYGEPSLPVVSTMAPSEMGSITGHPGGTALATSTGNVSFFSPQSSMHTDRSAQFTQYDLQYHPNGSEQYWQYHPNGSEQYSQDQLNGSDQSSHHYRYDM